MAWIKGNNGQSWPDWRVELLKELWSDGLSATMIGISLGFDAKDKGRCAVLGKARRLGLAVRRRNATETKDPERDAEGVGAVFDPAIWVIDPGHLSDTAVAVLRLKAGMCKFSEDDPRKPGFHFCEKPRHVGQYCELHAGIVYNAPKQRRRQEPLSD